MSGAQTPSASFSRGLSSASPNSSLPPRGEGAGTHSADVVRWWEEDQGAAGGGPGFGEKYWRTKEGVCRGGGWEGEIQRCRDGDDDSDEDGLEVSRQPWQSKTNTEERQMKQISRVWYIIASAPRLCCVLVTAGGAACAGGVWCHQFKRCIKVGSLASDTLGHTCQAGSYQDIKARRLFKLLLSFYLYHSWPFY